MSDTLTRTLTPDQAALWQQYLSAEAKGQRKSALQVLQAFISALQGDTELRQRDFSEAFCTQVADEGRILPLREPLFAGIIGPFLAAMNQQQGWQTEVTQFRKLIQSQNEPVINEERIRYWEFHFHGYADYLTHRDQYHNYADYIQSHWKASC